ncbi:hypothetical protein [Streptomyces sp. NPDC047000]|uniref:hypothetical protein n=1 Tax=Streptomyces sp. NPDC047000 TaxID=3155474 RepID=UPI003409FF1B
MTTYDDTTAAALLDAGAVLPLGSTSREDADTLTVRTYTHPALDGRRVVRLVPGTLGAAEDLALDFLGLAREPEAPEAGQIRRETLGFPAWALVNDPANGHHALALVQDVERLARQAWSRPGTAKDGFEELGERLGRAVPHFLPTFYEEAARVFLQQKNTAYAAAFFGKAREAERVHALAVDEERQRAVFLEFAFAGALTVKALKEYVKDLSRRLEPAAAWAQFRQLSVERCAAGMPPYASLPQDARALLKAAGLDRVTEECALLAELIASPAVVRAPVSFWTAYRPALAVLAEREPAVRARLLEIMPSGLGRGPEPEGFWLALLAETGADLLLTGQERPAGQDVDAADWLSRWAVHRKYGSGLSQRSEATLGLVARMAPKLRADGRPVDLFSGRWYTGAELDLLDLCAAEGVPLTMPEGGTAQLPLDRWLNDTRPGRRDLAAVAADPRLRPLLHRALDDLGHRTTPKLLADLTALPALHDVLREWLEERAAEFTRSAGLPGARTALSRMRVFRPVAARVNAAAVARVAAHEIAPLAGRTLRAGIADELGWPALDEALRLLDTETKPGERTSLTVTEAWPALILSRRHKAVVVGPDAVLLEHDLRLPCTPGDHRHPYLRYVDGQLLVMWRDGNRQSGYWSGRPAQVFTVGGEQLPWYGGAGITTPSVPLPGGGRATGGRTLHAGDTVLPPSRTVLGDGTGYWRQGRQGRRQVWLEYDPATGTHGRASLPAFLASAVREDATLLQDHCEVLPLQPGLENSPFGTDGAVLGRWVRREDGERGGATVCGTPDGRTVTLAQGRGHGHDVPLGALRLPGDAGPVAVRTGRQIALFAPDDTTAAGELGRVTPGEAGGDFAAGTALVPPLAFWHALRPRDEGASAVLRALTDEQVAEVLAAVAAALAEREARLAAARGSGTDGTDPDEDANADADADAQIVPPAEEVARLAVARAMPDLTDERIRSGVSSLLRKALRLAASAAEFAAPPAASGRAAGADRRRTHGMFADYSPEHGDDLSLREATTGLAPHPGWWGGGQQWTALRQIRAVNHVLSGQPADGRPLAARLRSAALGDGWVSDEYTVPAIGMRWPPALAVLRPLVYRAAAPDIPEAERETLLLLFEAIAEGPLAAPGGGLREILLGEPYSKQDRTGQVLRRAGRTVIVLGRQSRAAAEDRVTWSALDHDPSGGFGAIAHFTLESEIRYSVAFPAGGLAAVTRLLRERGAAPWRPDAPAALTAATDGGLGPAQAALLLIGRPHQPGAAELAAIGLKPRERALADGLLNALDPQDRAALVGALLPTDPAGLWTSGPDTAAAGRVWAERLGSLVRVPEDVAASLTGVSAASAEAVLNPARTPWLSRTTVQRPDKDGDLVAEDPSAVPSRSHLTDAVEALAALAYTLPHGHALRAALPAGLEALRRRLADPGLLLDLDLEWSDRGRSTASELRTAYGMPATGGADAQGGTPAGHALVLRHWYGDMETVLLRPAALTGPDDAVFGLLEGIVGPARSSGLRALRAVFGKDLEGALAAHAADFTGHAQDPSLSVPDLVTEVAAAHGLGEDAAALYLMLLALPDPTDRECVRWTGWKPARAKRARAELAASGLVVEARRARAGRNLFLPCGWLDLKAPALPVELWKRELYPVHDRTRTVPPLPVTDLFARAWDRVRSGDAPAYEELTTGTTRKGRSKR